ncbi:MAG TPA: PDZ domain-containing protein, partial [Gemmatimonadaceae bacterium]|nr:PDZ domain-containing protein [Gemmatimonadaceae bacterium]
YSLMSAEGGRRFANIRPGQRLTLNVSRGKSQMTLLLKATTKDAGDERSFGNATPEVSGTWTYEFPAAPATPANPAIPPRAAIASVPPEPPAVPASPASPTGWFGFSIRCSECGWSQSRGDDSPVWESSTAPELSMISREGPAARAGLMAGDVLTHINGVSILTPQGARMFGRVHPGQRISLTVRRDGKTLTKVLTLATRPELRAAIAATTPTPRAAPARRELRYAGELDNVSVEVWSAGGPTVERTPSTITITVGGSVIRLKAK